MGKWEVMKLEMQAEIISQRILWLGYLDFILSVVDVRKRCF